LGIDLPSDVLALAAQPDQNRMPSKICEWKNLYLEAATSIQMN
jgi:hypothetical protein